MAKGNKKVENESYQRNNNRSKQYNFSSQITTRRGKDAGSGHF